MYFQSFSDEKNATHTFNAHSISTSQFQFSFTENSIQYIKLSCKSNSIWPISIQGSLLWHPHIPKALHVENYFCALAREMFQHKWLCFIFANNQLQRVLLCCTYACDTIYSVSYISACRCAYSQEQLKEVIALNKNKALLMS